ncbi:MAG: CoA pyrophosphatase [Arenicellales bacterium]|nr:CoA pyrophosphatase [Arenicellales bacterium]MDP6550898.1 CoA pyrophosphatase [Arenicellales bacterium]
MSERIASNFADFERISQNGETSTRAAVMVLVTRAPDPQEGSVILTRRAKALRRHAGQYALPGGRLDPRETAVEAALRECREEVGLNPGPGHVIGLLDDFVTESGFCITPVVACMDAALPLAPDPAEVERVFHIPLEELAAAHTEVSRSQADESVRNGFSIMLPTVGHEIYAPTAAILYQFREVALLGRTTRVSHLGQPRFAWR